jgi:(p)ppGpp synthase/HD superfamily hydrolase
MELIEEAERLAYEAHEGQVRKTDGTPYVLHPLAVSGIVKDAGFSALVVAAAMVHDVLEDTQVSEEELRRRLGEKVAAIVRAVTEDKTLPWKERKIGYIEQVAASAEDVWAVSIADKIHNARSLLTYHREHGARTWERFSTGKEEKLWFERALYERLLPLWRHPLLEEYGGLIAQLEALD